jgi:hypothetical protein
VPTPRTELSHVDVIRSFIFIFIFAFIFASISNKSLTSHKPLSELKFSILLPLHVMIRKAAELQYTSFKALPKVHKWYILEKKGQVLFR